MDAGCMKISRPFLALCGYFPKNCVNGAVFSIWYLNNLFFDSKMGAICIEKKGNNLIRERGRCV